MKKVGIYVYRANDDYPSIIESQIKMLQDYATVHDGAVVEKYIDIGRCCNYKQKLDLKRLIGDCKKGKLDEVLVLRARHLSRKADEFYEIYNRVTESGVALNIVETPNTDELLNGLKMIGILRTIEKEKKKELMNAERKALLNEYGPKKIE